MESSKTGSPPDGSYTTIDHNSITLVQDTIPVGLTSDRYWRVEMEKNSYGDTGHIPMVELGWLPHELLFVARGEGPFVLAYGSARLVEAKLNNSAPGLLTQFTKDNEETLIKEAVLLPKVVLGGTDVLAPEPPPLPWRKWMLWGVLVLGVGFVAIMALNLGKAMNKGKED